MFFLVFHQTFKFYLDIKQTPVPRTKHIQKQKFEMNYKLLLPTDQLTQVYTKGFQLKQTSIKYLALILKKPKTLLKICPQTTPN